MLLVQPPDVVERILCFLTPVQAFAALRSCRELRAAVQAAARADLLSKPQCPGLYWGDQLDQYLRHRARTGDRINLLVRGPPMPTQWVGVVAVCVVVGTNEQEGTWRLDFLDGRGSEDIEHSEIEHAYGEWYKLRI